MSLEMDWVKVILLLEGMEEMGVRVAVLSCLMLGTLNMMEGQISCAYTLSRLSELMEVYAKSLWQFFSSLQTRDAKVSSALVESRS